MFNLLPFFFFSFLFCFFFKSSCINFSNDTQFKRLHQRVSSIFYVSKREVSLLHFCLLSLLTLHTKCFSETDLDRPIVFINEQTFVRRGSIETVCVL